MFGNFGISDVYKEYNRGESAEPCGTPAIKGLGFDRAFSWRTQKDRPLIYDWISETRCRGRLSIASSL